MQEIHTSRKCTCSTDSDIINSDSGLCSKVTRCIQLLQDCRAGGCQLYAATVNGNGIRAQHFCTAAVTTTAQHFTAYISLLQASSLLCLSFWSHTCTLRKIWRRISKQYLNSCCLPGSGGCSQQQGQQSNKCLAPTWSNVSWSHHSLVSFPLRAC